MGRMMAEYKWDHSHGNGEFLNKNGSACLHLSFDRFVGYWKVRMYAKKMGGDILELDMPEYIDPQDPPLELAMNLFLLVHEG
jgi:hypothetical protein